jgi:hypothetical protein
MWNRDSPVSSVSLHIPPYPNSYDRLKALFTSLHPSPVPTYVQPKARKYVIGKGFNLVYYLIQLAHKIWTYENDKGLQLIYCLV